MTVKRFGTLAVVGAWSGLLLKERGFNEIHEVFDHFYPGIMTLGVAAMSQPARHAIETQLPRLADELGDIGSREWQAYARRAIELFGDTLELDGPIKDVKPEDGNWNFGEAR